MENEQRMEDLLKVLRFDSHYEKVFTAFERIYIQYERAEILRRRQWQIPEELEEKVQSILTKIKQMRWKFYEY